MANAKTKTAVNEWVDAVKDDESVDESVKIAVQKVASAVTKGTSQTKHLSSDIVIELFDKILTWPADRLDELVLVVTGKNPKVLETAFDAQVAALIPKDVRY